jgi:hypothetical protein
MRGAKQRLAARPREHVRRVEPGRNGLERSECRSREGRFTPEQLKVAAAKAKSLLELGVIERPSD